MGQIGVIIADPTEPATPITGLNAGNRYLFVWTLDNIGCPTASDTVSVYYYSVKPNITGSQFVCTGEDCTVLNTLGLQTWEFGTWESKTGNLVFTPPNNPSTTVCGLVPGANEVYWTINNNACPGHARDTFTVNYEIFPQANADNVEVAFGDTVHFQVLSNDILPTDPPEVSIIVPPNNGIILANPSNGQYVYRPNSGFSGVDMLIYRICNVRCGPTACSTAIVSFEVGEAGDCYIPTIITPNADGRNDTFKLPPECYYFGEGEDAIELTIFNQWGDYVYHKNPFVRDADAWDGADLPAGTYYYVIKFGGTNNAKAGFILLQR
jgi:gliding motility-associated-like protein